MKKVFKTTGKILLWFMAWPLFELICLVLHRQSIKKFTGGSYWANVTEFEL